jgi:hypothetical protein
MDEVEKNFFASFQILGPLVSQGWVVIPQNVKKVKILIFSAVKKNLFAAFERRVLACYHWCFPSHHVKYKCSCS